MIEQGTEQVSAPVRDRRRDHLPAVAALLIVAGAGVFVVPDLLRAPGAGFDPIARFLLAVAVIVVVSHLLGTALKRIHQPPVVGEILGGLLLGPSALGALWPQGSAFLFPPVVVATLEMTAQLGLVIFMFLLGCELKLSVVRSRGAAIGVVVAGAMGLPFICGAVIALTSESVLGGSANHRTAYVIFVGLALSITALPVLARILSDLKLDGTSMGVLALASAAVGDVIAWIVLTAVLGSTGLSATGQVGSTIALTVALVAGAVSLVRPALSAIARRPGTEQLMLPILVAGAITFAAITQLIGLHPVIGAFLFGAVVPRNQPAIERINRQLQGFTLAILLPLFFAGVGLSTSIGLLGGSPQYWLIFVAILLTATVSKFVGASGAARLSGMPPRASLGLGALMNCRGVTEIVVASIGWKSGLINTLGLTILILVALLTTAMTGPVVRALAPRGGWADADPLRGGTAPLGRPPAGPAA